MVRAIDKKILSTIFILIFALFHGTAYTTTAQTITYTYDFSNLQIDTLSTSQGTFSIISLDDCLSSNTPGCPLLPIYVTNIELPVGKTIGSISTYFHLKSKITLANPIIPAQDFTHSGDDNNTSFSYNLSHYQQNEFEFDDLLNVDLQYARGIPILIVSMRPVNYNPQTDQIYVYDKISFTISFTDAPILPFNREYGATYDGGICSPSEKYDYVIITDASLNSSWQPLIDHRSSFSHLNCTKITVQDIDACPDYWNTTPLFNDTQAHIREFIKDAYQDWGTDYVLLGGDWRDGVPSEQIVPYRLFTDRLETDAYKTMPCDMYYSHLDGNWYYSAGGVWGGGPDTGANDKFAEVYIGRITAYNETMVQNAVDKIIWYDECDDTAWLNKTSFWGGALGWTVTSKQYMEELRLGTDTYRTFTGFEEWNADNPDQQINTNERLYHADLGSSYKTYFSNSVENDNFSIVNHLDHSSYDTPFGLPNWLYRYNTKPFFGYSQGCLAGRFNSGYAGCEQMMCRHSDRHAFALVLNTGYGYGSTIDTDSPSQLLNCYFWDYFFNQTADSSEWQLGKAQTYSLDKLGAIIDGIDHAWCYNWYSSHLFGDPAQTLKIQAENQSVNHAPAISNEYPLNGSIGLNLSLIWNATVTDQDGDMFGLNISCTNGQWTYWSNATNGTFNISLSGLVNDTWYTVNVLADDGNATTQENYTFRTRPSEYPKWDITEDGCTNYLDISALVSHYGESGVPDWIPEDIIEDGIINYLDVSSLVSHYGESY